ncbi:TfpX/TfpZ family type IV pilin accessory protein [Dentiradicibacter hellwigii]|uniref:TfpX/TfpZ family type IV pilin accessory protein n=1 Tax=Dentiradicibacter hellwigii TaxID=3149053 RepID=A0ABV4UFP4_9RHOO
MSADQLNHGIGHSMVTRLRASGIHFVISATVAFIVAGLVFWLWYPTPHQHLSGGIDLFVLLISVDLVIGPLLTLIVFNLSKPRRELVRDLFIIAILQAAALMYGMHVVFQARPVHVVFEYTRFRVVYASDLLPEFLNKAPEAMRHLPWTGPTFLSVRPMRAEEKLDILLQELSGFPLANRADMWQPYAEAASNAAAIGKSVTDLMPRLTSAQQASIRALMAQKNLSEKDVVYVPLLSRSPQVAAVLVEAHSGQILMVLDTSIE